MHDGLRDYRLQIVSATGWFRKIRVGPQVLAFYRNLLNLRLLFKNQKKIKLFLVSKWLDIFELKMPKLIDICGISIVKNRTQTKGDK